MKTVRKYNRITVIEKEDDHVEFSVVIDIDGNYSELREYVKRLECDVFVSTTIKNIKTIVNQYLSEHGIEGISHYDRHSFTLPNEWTELFVLISMHIKNKDMNNYLKLKCFDLYDTIMNNEPVHINTTVKKLS